jgi:hypothetical protein
MIDFSQGGRPSGSLDLTPKVVGRVDSQHPSDLPPPTAGTLMLNLVMTPGTTPPDLIIKVFERRYAGRAGQLQFVVTSPLAELSDLPVLDGDFGTVDLKTDVTAWVESRLGALNVLAHMADSTPDFVSGSLAGVGYSLFEQLIPRELQDLFWIIRGRNVRTILILSDEPHIPWELIKPFRDNPETGEFEEGDFWGHSYALTRWLRGRPPAQRFSFKRICALTASPKATSAPEAGVARDMVPLASSIDSHKVTSWEFSTSLPLASEEELAVLRSLETGGSRFQLLPARCRDILKAFAGSSLADASAVLMEDGAFHAADLTPKMVGALRRSKPLIFFNSCQSGRLGFSLTRLGSWGAQFVHLGCGGFVGTLWPVTDRAASSFAQAFYQSMSEGRPIGEAMQGARQRVRECYPNDPTWLAYCCFADPQARIVSPARTSVQA